MVFVLAVAREQRSTLPEGAGCCVMMKESAENRCFPPFPTCSGDWVVLAVKSLFVDLYMEKVSSGCWLGRCEQKCSVQRLSVTVMLQCSLSLKVRFCPFPSDFL